MIVLKKVLVATDFSSASDAALAYGRELARTFNAQLHVLHVVETMAAGYSLEAGYIGLPELQKQLEEAARKQVEALVTDDDRKTLRAQPVLDSSPRPARTIADYAAAEKIDLVVVGTHGRGGVSRVLLGSIAEKVVRIAPCPVLTVRSIERDFLAPDALATIAKA